MFQINICKIHKWLLFKLNSMSKLPLKDLIFTKVKSLHENYFFCTGKFQQSFTFSNKKEILFRLSWNFSKFFITETKNISVGKTKWRILKIYKKKKNICLQKSLFFSDSKFLIRFLFSICRTKKKKKTSELIKFL